MPQGATRAELKKRNRLVAELCKKSGFMFSPRLHIMLFGDTRAT